MKKIFTLLFVTLMSVSMFGQEEYTIALLNAPATDKPASINIVGSFGATTMELLQTGWFFSEVEATQDGTFKFCDASNENKILCQKVDGQWIQAIFTFGEKWWDDSWKGVECKWLEIDAIDAQQYAWMEGMPDVSGISGVEAVTAEDGAWYTLSGVKLDSKPTEKGIYICNGKKYVIQ